MRGTYRREPEVRIALRFNPPPGWPVPPAGWGPPPNWQPDRAWPPPPYGWPLWIDDGTGWPTQIGGDSREAPAPQARVRSTAPGLGSWVRAHKKSSVAVSVIGAMLLIGSLDPGDGPTKDFDAVALSVPGLQTTPAPGDKAPPAGLTSVPEAENTSPAPPPVPAVTVAPPVKQAAVPLRPAVRSAAPKVVVKAQARPADTPKPAHPRDKCDAAYPTICIPPNSPDLNCPDIAYTNFKVLAPDPHGFDREGDGIGCERR